MNFGENLQKIRKEKNISQETLAEMLGISRQAVSKWEQNTGYPEMEKLLKLSKVLNTTLDELINVNADNKESNFVSKKLSSDKNDSIFIKTYDGKKIVKCIKIECMNVVGSSKDKTPQFALIGIETANILWGDKKIILGYYKNSEVIEEEIKSIYESIANGCTLYELKYSAKIKKGFNLLLDE